MFLKRIANEFSISASRDSIYSLSCWNLKTAFGSYCFNALRSRKLSALNISVASLAAPFNMLIINQIKYRFFLAKIFASMHSIGCTLVSKRIMVSFCGSGHVNLLIDRT
jgi:hypothetical protein